MPANLARIYVDGNNHLLNDTLKNCLKNKNLEVVTTKIKNDDYRLLVYDLGENGNYSSSAVLDDLNSATDFSGKICLVLVRYSQQNGKLADQYYSDIQPYLNDRKNNLRLIQTRDLYHNGNETITAFESYLCHIEKIKEINVTAAGSKKYYPTSTDDLCELIIKSLFITNTGGKTFVGLTEEITDLELAYLLKKTLEKRGITLDINLNAKEEKDEDEDKPMALSVQTQAQLNWIPKTNFSDELLTVLDHDQPSQEGPPQAKPGLKRLTTQTEPKKSIETETVNLHQKEERGLAKVIIVSLLIVIVLAAIQPIIFVSSLYFSTTGTYQAFKEIRNGEVEKSQKHLHQAQNLHWLSANTFQSIVPLGRLIDKNTINSMNNYLLILGHGQSLIESIIDTYSLGNQLYLGLLGKQPTEPKTIIAALRVNLVSISEKLSQIQLLYGQVKLPFGYGDRISSADLNQSINLLKSQITLALPLLDLVERIGTNQGLQRYLIVVQDTNELRPTGGFISTYGVLTLDQGKIIDFQVDSSLSLDRLIEGKVEPPNIVKQLLGQSNWSFHDSNLDADFEISAKQMSWFYQRFKNVNLDGVIGLNTNFLRFVLEQTGSVVLADNQTVSQDNLSSLASNPTASKGLDIITALTQTLGNNLTSGKIFFAAISRSLLKAVSLHEITIWFSAPTLESFAEASDISGEVTAQNCHPQLSALNCHADTVYLNESNMSINKLNYYLKRSQNLVVQIATSGQVDYALNYDYSYPVPAPSTQAGLYKVYYQLYLPAAAQNATISLDTQTLNPKSLVQSNLAGLTKIEFSAGLSINQPHHLEIHFTSPNILDLKKQLVPYTLAILKQPGTLSDTFTVKIRYPENLLARNMTIPLKQTSAQELVLQTDQVSQENLGIIFKNQSL